MSVTTIRESEVDDMQYIGWFEGEEPPRVLAVGLPPAIIDVLYKLTALIALNEGEQVTNSFLNMCPNPKIYRPRIVVNADDKLTGEVVVIRAGVDRVVRFVFKSRPRLDQILTGEVRGANSRRDAALKLRLQFIQLDFLSLVCRTT